MKKRHILSIASTCAIAVALLVAGGCSKKGGEGGGASAVNIDGSSTVYPVTQAVAEEFAAGGDTRVTVGVSGTGGGFKKLCRGEVHLTGASRPIKESEREQCAEAGVEFIELPIAYDGIAVVVHPDNDWVDQLTLSELKAMWEPAAQGKITKWNQIRGDWPDRDIHLFGPGVDSGTYDYFTAAVVGQEHASRGDFTSSEDDNVLVQGVATDEVALGFFGFAYYVENQDRLRHVPIVADSGAEAVAPTKETISGGTYQPLTRPLFLYVSKQAADHEAVSEFVEFFLTEGAPFVDETGYVSLPARAYELALERFAERATGSAFEGGAQIGVTAEELLKGS
jgi:phosphate transport system substrate-binding protein